MTNKKMKLQEAIDWVDGTLDTYQTIQEDDLINDDLVKETADYLKNVSIMDLNYNESWLNSYKIENIAKEYVKYVNI